MTAIDDLNRTIVACRACPRLVEWRESVGRNPPKSYAGQHYWSKPLTGFGDPSARLMIVGLAPAAHGGNRTGRIFTGDRSGDFLFRALYEVGLATSPLSVSKGDGTELRGCYLTAVVKCAPPANKPLPAERDSCIHFLIDEIEIVRPETILALGGFAWDGILRATKDAGGVVPSPKPRFTHGSETSLRWSYRSAGSRRISTSSRRDTAATHPIKLIGSYHPSQQNTFTGKLTMEMFVEILRRVLETKRSRIQ
jgi:uracil-DNA glycosylase family 4